MPYTPYGGLTSSVSPRGIQRHLGDWMRDCRTCGASGPRTHPDGRERACVVDGWHLDVLALEGDVRGCASIGDGLRVRLARISLVCRVSASEGAKAGMLLGVL